MYRYVLPVQEGFTGILSLQKCGAPLKEIRPDRKEVISICLSKNVISLKTKNKPSQKSETSELLRSPIPSEILPDHSKSFLVRQNPSGPFACWQNQLPFNLPQRVTVSHSRPTQQQEARPKYNIQP
jgi:hypothetical protein